MRILLAHSFYRVPGGEDRYVNEQVQLLARHHDVDLIGPRNNDLTHDIRTAARMAFSPAEVREVEAHIIRFKPDIVHLHNPYPALGPAVHVAARRRSVPIVMTVHNLRLRCPNGLMYTQGADCRRCEGGNYVNAVLHHCFPSTSQAFAYGFALWTHRFMLRLEKGIDRFIVPSSFMKGRLGEWGISVDKIELIRNFISLPATTARPGTFGMYVGRLSAEKGVDTLLHALREAGDPRFQVVGDGPLRESLTALAGRLGLERTVFTGRLSWDDVAARLCEARFVAMPSMCDENAPLAVLEAMASGRPVLVSRRGGLPELIERGGGLACEPGKPKDWARSIRLLMTDDELCSTLGAQARLVAGSEFSAERHVSHLEDVYRRVCFGGATRTRGANEGEARVSDAGPADTQTIRGSLEERDP